MPAAEFRKEFGPRGVIHSYSDGRVQDTGPLTRKRMETVDEEFHAAAMDFVDRAQEAKKPFFLWYNSTRMHVWTRLKKESQGVTGAMHCGVGPTGAGCFGFTSWDKTVMFEAIVWNMVDLTEEARIRVDSEGTSYVIGIVAPIPLLTRAESQACEGMGDQLKSYFTQEVE